MGVCGCAVPTLPQHSFDDFSFCLCPTFPGAAAVAHRPNGGTVLPVGRSCGRRQAGLREGIVACPVSLSHLHLALVGTQTDIWGSLFLQPVLQVSGVWRENVPPLRSQHICCWASLGLHLRVCESVICHKSLALFMCFCSCLNVTSSRKPSLMLSGGYDLNF